MLAFRELKERISIFSFFNEIIGVEPNGNYSGVLRYSFCPSCGLKAGSNKVSVIEKGFHCFSCGAKGDIINAASMYWGVNVSKAAQMLNGDAVSLPPAVRKPFLPTEAKRDESSYLELVSKFISAPRVSDVGARNYLLARGISHRTIDSAIDRGLLVFLPSNPTHASNWLDKHIGSELLMRTNLLKPGNKSSAVIYKPICFISDNKAAIEFRIASEKRSESDIKSIRYGSGAPWTWVGKKGVMVTEGVIDLLSAVELGTERTILAIPGCQSYKVEWFEKYKGEQILLALDSDGPGVDASLRMKADLEGCGHTVHIYRLPDGCKDLNDRLMITRSSK